MPKPARAPRTPGTAGAPRTARTPRTDAAHEPAPATTQPAARAGARSRSRSTRRPQALAAARWDPAVECDPLAGVLPGISDPKGDIRFLARLGRRNWRAESRAVAVSELYTFADWLREHRTGITVLNATAAEIAAYRDHLTAQGLSATTVRLALVCLQLYYDFVANRDKDPDNPARQVPLPDRELPAVLPYTRAEAQAILTAAATAATAAWSAGDTVGWMEAERDYAMLSCLYYTGIRRGELRRLRIDNVNLRRATIHIKGKGGAPRTITIPAVLVAIVSRYLDLVRASTDSAAFVFAELDRSQREWVNAGADADRRASRYRTPSLIERARREDSDYGLGPYTLTYRANIYGRIAGVDGLHGAHRWRHTHGSDCAMAGISLAEIAARLGHSIDNRKEGIGWEPITLDYIHLGDHYLHQVVAEALPDPLTPAG